MFRSHLLREVLSFSHLDNMRRKGFSFNCFLIAVLFISLTHFLYYPKWDQSGSELTLSWDVSGYYMYLPAAFIYNDLRQCEFRDDIIRNYQPSSQFDQAYLHVSGNYVMKYSMGQAVLYAPFFFIAHGWATLSSAYSADGFSFPYQFMISIGSLLFAFLGLLYLRKILLHYFDEITTGMSILALVFGTNYLNYTAIDGAMTHNYLFTLNAILICTTIKFYQGATRGGGHYHRLVDRFDCPHQANRDFKCIDTYSLGCQFIQPRFNYQSTAIFVSKKACRSSCNRYRGPGGDVSAHLLEIYYR